MAQITYYFHAYFAVSTLPSWSSGSHIRFVTPTGNFGDILAGFFAKRMGLPVERLVVATNENDILDRFFKSGRYEKRSDSATADVSMGLPGDGAKAQPTGALETLSPAMDIVVSSNFERLLYILQLELNSFAHEETAKQVSSWLSDLKNKGGFAVSPELHAAATREFESEKVTNPQTLATIRTFFAPPLPNMPSYVLDPHSAIGIAASLRSIARAGPPQTHTISLATAHPAKFANAVTLALEKEEGFNFDRHVLTPELKQLDDMEKRVTVFQKWKGVDGLREVITQMLEQEKASG